MAAPTPTYTQVTPHIAKLNLPFFRGRFPVGVWLVRDDAGGWVMVDAGAPGFEKAVLEQTLVHTGGEKPKLLVLTHGHLDHAAFAKRIREEWKTPIAAHRDELPFLIGPKRYNTIKFKNPIYWLLQLSPPPLVGRNIQLPLDDGRELPAGLKVYHVPGHAPGMIALHHAADRALISADAFNHMGKLSDPPAGFTYDPGLNHKSQVRLVGLEFDHLLMSHGDPIMNSGRAQAREFVAARERKKAKPARRAQAEAK
jgi:glyoxylase-like metal-dependent hydrolase (beta-lactamase superfamily II)